MKSRLLLLLLVAVCFLASCGDRNTRFTVAGEVENMPDQQVVLEELRINEILVLDSAKTKNGKFELSSYITEPGLYRLRFSESRFILLSLDKGTTRIKSNWSDLENYVVSGSPSSASLRQFITTVREHIRDFNSISVVIDSMQARKNDSLLAMAMQDLKEMNFQFTRYIENYADTTRYLPNALFAVQTLNRNVEKDYILTFTSTLPSRFPNSKLAQEYTDMVNQMYGAAQQKQLAGIQPGTTAPEIRLPTPEGKELTLSSMRGKYVLVDFWASWCGPCRAENPNVVAAFNKFKDKNFTILGVSLDQDKNKWQEAIKKDSLDWTHISDLQGWESIAARNYKIESIPANFLVDPEGKIIARDLRGPALEAKLAEVIK